MSRVELCCDACRKPLRILTIADKLVVVSDWYMGLNQCVTDLCEHCYIGGGYRYADEKYEKQSAIPQSHYYHHTMFSRKDDDLYEMSRLNWNIEWLRGGGIQQAGEGIGDCRDEIY